MYLTVLQSGAVLSVVLGLMMSEHENIAREAHVLTLKVIHTCMQERISTVAREGMRETQRKSESDSEFPTYTINRLRFPHGYVMSIILHVRSNTCVWFD